MEDLKADDLSDKLEQTILKAVKEGASDASLLELTEVLGECWHEISFHSDETSIWYECSCLGNKKPLCSDDLEEHQNRTFTTDTDMLAVFRAIRDKGKWSEFSRYAGKHWLKDEDAWNEETPFEVWLFLDNPERACVLAAMWWEEQGK